MRMIRNLAALCLALMMMCAPALAEAPFLMHSAGWTMSGVPLTVTLFADVTSRMPYDDNRMAMLKAITDNLSLRLTTGENEGSVLIRVGKWDTLSLAYKDDAVQISTIPDRAFTTAENPMNKLLGMAETEFSLYGLRGDAETLLDDGWVLLEALCPALEPYGKRIMGKTNIVDIGTAHSRTEYNIPAQDAEQLKETLLALCPEGWLREIISGLTFTDKQQLRVFHSKDEVPMRVEYNGTCGTEGSLRKVNLVWRMLRGEKERRDDVTLTSPAKTGGDKNSLEFERVIKTNKAGAIEMKGSFTYTETANKETTTRKGEFKLTNAYTDAADVISGSFTLKQKLPGESSFTGTTIAPEVTISGTANAPVISGSVGVSTLSGKNVLDQATLHLSVTPGAESLWQPRAETVDLDALTTEELTALQQSVLGGVTTELVRTLIILMQEDAEWFFRDMPPDAVQKIVDATGTVILD